MSRRSGLDIRRQYAEHCHVVVIGFDESLRDLVDGLTGLKCRCIYFVIDVRDVSRERQLVLAPKQTSQQIEDDRRPGIADVRIVVDRRPTQVHRHVTRLKRFERDLLCPECVVQKNRHTGSKICLRVSVVCPCAVWRPPVAAPASRLHGPDRYIRLCRLTRDSRQRAP